MSSPCTIMSSNKAIVFDPSLIQTRPTFLKEFIWPTGYNLNNQSETNDDHIGGHVLNEPLIDLEGFFMGDEEAITRAADLINKACVTHGLFQVTNHRVDPELIGSAHDQLEGLFELPLQKKQRVQRKAGELWGYSGAHTDRFSKELSWKETFSFGYPFLHERITGSGYKPVVVDYFISAFGQEFQHAGWVYQKYCEAMKEVSVVIFELLAISLGVERQHFREFYEDGNSIMRCNEPSLTFGTGTHCDPTSLTILHQDQVGGLQVFADKWQSVRPRSDALVINIGDTLSASPMSRLM